MPDAKPRKCSAPVLRLVPRTRPQQVQPDRDTIDCLRMLLREARVGKVTGLAFCAMLPDRGYMVDTTGEVALNPTFSRGMVRALDDKLAKLVHER